jgi:arylesterase/paraoxonase
MQTLETYLQLPGAKVVYYQDGRFRPAIEDLVFPNGINVSPDGGTIFVVTVTNRSVLVYDRDPDAETLTLKDEIFIETGGDNVEVDADGNLWIGSHPKLLAFVAHAEDPTKLAPGQVIRVSPDPKGGYRIDEVYLNAGDEIAGTSVAARRGQRLLIGQVFGNGILDCIMD